MSFILFALLINPASVKLPQAEIGLHEPSEWNWYYSLDVISETSDGWSTHPAIFSDDDGIMHAVWQDSSDYMGAGTDADIFYTFGHFYDWYEIEIVSSVSTSSASGSPDVAVDDWGNVHVVWMDSENYNSSGTDFDIFYRYKNATSGLWGPIYVVSDTSTWDSYNATLAVDHLGDVHVAWVDSTNYDSADNDFDIFYRKFDAMFNVWYPVTVISSQSTATSDDPAITLSPSPHFPFFWDVNIFWSDAAAFGEAISWENIYHRDWNISRGWGSTTLVSWESNYSSYMPAACTGPSGNIHVAWFDKNNLVDTEIFYKRYDRKLLNWTNAEAIAVPMSNTSSRCAPCIGVDTADSVHIAWVEEGNYTDSGHDDDIFYKRLYTEINTWTTPEMISGRYFDESTSDSCRPDMAVDPAGNILVVWDDFTDWDMENDFDIFSNQFGSAPEAPILVFLLPPPTGHMTDTGIVELQWNTVVGASDYCVYRSSSFIRQDVYVEKSQIGWNKYGYFMDTLTEPGIYYYIVEAQNANGRTYSNCVFVEYKIPTLNEFILIAGMIGGVAIIVSVITLTRRKKKL
ncbi:MAG: hypothetical protein ACTSUP_07350 [Candidatus Heimdallarchaeaceae archaeon]